jgi:FAD binding domain
MSRTGLRLNRYVESFDESYDVVVVGLGFAGAVTAIEAHDRGARVLIVEKMPDPGGISICSGGGVRCTNDANSAYEYVKATNAGTARDDVVRTFANGMAGIQGYFEALAHSVDAQVEWVQRSGTYPFPGFESLAYVQVTNVPASMCGKNTRTPTVHNEALIYSRSFMKISNVEALRSDSRLWRCV